MCSLYARHIFDRFSIHRGWLLLDRFSTPPRLIEIPLHAFHFSLFCIFFLCVHSIFFFFFLKVYGSLFSSLPLYLFYVCLVKSFGFLYPLTIVSKRRRNLRIECLSSGGVIDLRGELHVKRKKVFNATNLGGELV